MGLARKRSFCPRQLPNIPHRRFAVVWALAGVIYTQSFLHAVPLTAHNTAQGWSFRVQHNDSRVRRATVWTLGRRAREAGSHSVTSNTVVVALRSQLVRETHLPTVCTILGVLGSIATPESEEVLQSFAARLPATQRRLRVVVARILAHGSSPRLVLGSLLQLTQSIAGVGAGDTTNELAIRTLSELDHENFTVALSMAQQQLSVGLPGMVRAIGLRGDPRWGGIVIEALRPTRLHDPNLVFAALDATARLRLTEAAGLVVSYALSDGDLTLRRTALATLASLGGSFDPAPLRDLLREPSLREPTLETLGALGDRASVSAMVAHLDASWAGDRLAAAEALSDVSDVAALDAMISHASREPSAETRRALWRSIARLGDTRAYHALVASEDPLAQWALAELLQKTPSLRHRLNPSVRNTPAILVAAITGNAPTQTDLLQQNPQDRITVAWALGFAPEADLSRVDAFETALAREDHENNRVAIVLALASIAKQNQSDATGAACDILLDLVTREQNDLSVAAVAALFALGELRVGAARHVAQTIAASDGRNPLAQQAAIYTLSTVGTVLDALIVERALFVETNERVQNAAAVALVRLQGSLADRALTHANCIATSGAQIAHNRWAVVMGQTPHSHDTDSVRAGGAPPGSIWALSRPDGSLAFGIAADDGEVWITGASATETMDMFRVDVLLRTDAGEEIVGSRAGASATAGGFFTRKNRDRTTPRVCDTVP
jgi:hypothetical protein